VIRKDAFEYLTGEIAVSYRPRRMPWEHDQDSAEIQKQVLTQWVQLLVGYPDRVVREAFGALIRHSPTSVPTLNECRAQLKRLSDQEQASEPVWARGKVMAPETGFCVAYEAYCDELARQGRSPDETLFTKKFNAMFGGKP